MRFLSGILLMCLIFFSCDKDKIDFVTFNKELSNINFSANLKNAFIESVPEQSFLIGGQGQNGEFLIVSTDDKGDVKAVHDIASEGALHSLKFDENENGTGKRILALGEVNDNSMLFEVDSAGNLTQKHFEVFVETFNQKLGGIEFVKAYDFLIDENRNYYITGQLKQFLDPTSRVFALKLSADYQVLWSRVYTFNSIGLNLSLDQSKNLLIGGYEASNVAIYSIETENGNLNWNKTIYNVELESRQMATDVFSEENGDLLLSGWMLTNGDSIDFFRFASNGVSVGVNPEIQGQENSFVSQGFAKTRDAGLLSVGIPYLLTNPIDNFLIYRESNTEKLQKLHSIPNLVACDGLFQTADFGYAFLLVLRNDVGTFNLRVLKTDEVGEIR